MAIDVSLRYITESHLAKREGLESLILAPNIERDPVFFHGRVADPLLVRDGLLTLRDIVVSDFDTRLTEEELAMRLDPIATVAEDELSFEAFSQDESCYGRLALKSDLLGAFEAWQSGTTNVDFTDRLAKAVEAIRSSTPTGFVIEPSGFEVRTPALAVREKKVALPDGWLRGFANVQSSMCAPMESFELARADLRNILAFLKTHVERDGPRALVFHLKAGEPVEAVFEPWGHTIPLRSSRYTGHTTRAVRIWGRRRLTLLNRLLPRMNRLRVCLLGSGYPTFWLCDLGPAVFLLALSGWCIQPFSQSGLYLAAPREAVGSEQFVAVGETLKRLGKATFDDAVRSTNIAPEIVRTALSRLCEQGQSMYDIGDGCYRWRQALHIPVEELRADNDSKRESDAAELLRAGAVTVGEEHRSLDGATVKGKVRGKNGDYGVMLTMDTTGRIIDGECGCAWYRYNHLHSGPCKHLLALRLAFAKA